MDLIEQCFNEHNKALLKRLIAADFSIEEATQLLPEIELALYISSRKTGEFQTIARLFSKYPYEITKSVNVDALAMKVGIDADQVATGLRAIAPLLLQIYAENNHKRAQVSKETTTAMLQPQALFDFE